MINISGFEAANSINNLRVFSNIELQNFSGFNQLISVQEDIQLLNNPKLINVNPAFSILSTIGGDLDLDGNNLSNLNGFGMLKSIGGSLRIKKSYIKNIDFFQNLTSVGTDIIFSSNYELENLTGLSNINEEIDYLGIARNPKLSICAISVVCEYLASGMDNEIRLNAFNCNSSTEILANCN